jgi:hypothetical protein
MEVDQHVVDCTSQAVDDFRSRVRHRDKMEPADGSSPDVGCKGALHKAHFEAVRRKQSGVEYTRKTCPVVIYGLPD